MTLCALPCAELRVGLGIVCCSLLCSDKGVSDRQLYKGTLPTVGLRNHVSIDAWYDDRNVNITVTNFIPVNDNILFTVDQSPSCKSLWITVSATCINVSVNILWKVLDRGS